MNLKGIAIITFALFATAAFAVISRTHITGNPSAFSSPSENIPDSLSNTKRIAKLYAEVNSKFTFNGKPVNPAVINVFNGGDYALSDGPGSIITMDIAKANNSNEYFNVTGGTALDFGTDKASGMPQGFFSYEYLGKTDNNIHVVRTTYSGGGSGIFGTLLFFSFKVKKNPVKEGYEQDQLLMTLENWIILPDMGGAYGTQSKITIKPDRVIIDESSEDQNGKTIKSQSVIKF